MLENMNEINLVQNFRSIWKAKPFGIPEGKQSGFPSI